MCVAHAISMNRRECRKVLDICCKSKVHFCMRLLASLVNTRTLSESVELMRRAYFLMNSKYANKVRSTALHHIEKKGNTLNLDWKEEDDVHSMDDYLDTVEHENDSEINLNHSATNPKVGFAICKKMKNVL